LGLLGVFESRGETENGTKQARSPVLSPESLGRRFTSCWEHHILQGFCRVDGTGKGGL
jgi:hypothetical protein